MQEFPLSHQTFNRSSAEILQHHAFRAPSVWELVKDLVRPKARLLDCMQVEVTSQCGARCTYCPHTTEADTWQGQHMDALTFANLWPLLRQTNRVHLQGWGEPLLHPHFFDYVAFARKADCFVSTTSCGLHLTQKTSDRILESGMDIFAFSLAGTDATSNAVRDGADFHKVCENIRALEALRKKKMAVHLEIHVAYLMLADRMEAVVALPALMHDLGVNVAVISTLDYVPRPSLAALALPPEKIKELAQAAAFLAEAEEQARLYDVRLYCALPSRITTTQCRENIQRSLYVAATGTVSPCVYLNICSGTDPSTHTPHTQNSTCFGNVNTENALALWEKTDFATFRRLHAEGQPNTTLCKTCVKRFESANFS